ncbi:MAG TPA: hypothetical protein VD738_01660 [Nitrospira sp.]|nr:hypothetical protein [Nitrospira sp.]
MSGWFQDSFSGHPGPCGFLLDHPEYLLFFCQVRGVMPPDVDIAKELWDNYDGHLRRLAHLVESVSEGIGSTRDMATTFAAYTSGVLTYSCAL